MNRNAVQQHVHNFHVRIRMPVGASDPVETQKEMAAANETLRQAKRITTASPGNSILRSSKWPVLRFLLC